MTKQELQTELIKKQKQLEIAGLRVKTLKQKIAIIKRRLALSN